MKIEMSECNLYSTIRMETLLYTVIRRCFESLDCPRLTRNTLQKLCYLCDFEHYVRTEEHLSGETYIHGRNGPIPIHFDRAVRELITDDRLTVKSDGRYVPGSLMFDPHPPWQSDAIPPANVAPYHILPNLDSREMETIDSVIRRYAWMTSQELESLVKEDIPWRVTNEGQAMDYNMAFYRPEVQEGDDDE